MIPLKPNGNARLKELSQTASLPVASQPYLRVSELTSTLLTSLQRHATSPLPTTIYPVSETHDIHADCLSVHELCQAILASHSQQMKNKHLSQMINSLSVLEDRLKLQTSEPNLLKDVRKAIQDLEKAVAWTQPSSEEEIVPQKHSFWKTLLKVLVFGGLAGEAYAEKPRFDFQPIKASDGNSTHTHPLQPLNIHIEQPENTSWPETRSCIHIKETEQIQHLNNLVSNASIPIDNQLLLHVVGDRYGKETSLEGGNTVSNLAYLRSIIDQELYHLDQNPACRKQEREAFCHALFQGTDLGKEGLFSKLTLQNLREQITRAIAVGKGLQGDYSRFYSAVSSQLQTLTIGDAFFFPIRWPKHALACEIIRDAEDSYAVRIYNTGEGSDLNPYVYTTTGLKKLPFFEVVDVTANNLQDHAFYNGLWSLARIDSIRNAKDTLYYKLLPRLQGTVSHRSYHHQEFLPPQESGTCSMRVLSAVFCQLLGDVSRCHQLNWKLGLKALSDFYQQHQGDLTSNILSRNNLRKGLTEFAVFSHELTTRQMLSPDTFHYAADRAAEISSALDAAEMTYEAIQRASRPECNLSATPALLPASTTLPPYHSEASWLGQGVASVTATPFVSLPDFKPDHLVTDLQRLVDLLATLSRKVSGENGFYNYALAMQVVAQLPSATSHFWAAVPQNDISPAIERVTDLLFELTLAVNNYAIMENARQAFTPGDVTVGAMKLMAIMDCLAQRTAVGVPMLNLYQKSFGDICEGRHPSFSGLSPRATEQLAHIKDYWAVRKPTEADDPRFVSAFGIEATTPYALHHSDDNSGMELLTENSDMPDRHGIVRYPNTYGDDVLSYRDWGFQKWAEDYLEAHPGEYINWESKYTLWMNTFRRRLQGRKKNGKSACELFDNLKFRAIFGISYDRPTFSDEITALPRIFYALRDASFIASYFLQGYFGGPYLNEPNAKYFQNHPINHRLSWRAEVDAFHGSPRVYIGVSKGLFKPKGNGVYSIWTGDWFISQSFPSGMPIAQRPSSSETIADIWSSKGHRRRYTPEEINNNLSNLGLNQTTLNKLGIEITRNYLTLSSLRDLQISRTLSYFTQGLARNPSELWLLERLLFEPLVLREALTQDPAQVKLLLASFQRFIDQQYKAIKMGMDDADIIAFVRLHRRFQQEVDHIYATTPEELSENIQDLVPDVRRHIIDLLKLRSTSAALRTALVQELAISYTDTKTWDDASMTHFLWAHVSASSASDTTTLLIDQISTIEHQEAINRQFQKIATYLEERPTTQRDALLSHLVKAFVRNIAADVTWQPYDAFPMFKGISKGSSKTYYINLLSGDVTDETRSFSSLPTAIATHPVVNQLLKKLPGVAVSSSHVGQWYLTSRTGAQYRIKEWSGKVIIQKNIGEAWFQLDETPFMPALNRDRLCWIKSNWQMMIEEISNDQPFAFGEFHDKTVQIYKASATGEKTNWILEDVSQPNSQMHFLTDIEDPSEILFWRDETTGAPQEVVLPRLGLHFRAEEQGGAIRLISDALGGYVIAKEQSVDALADAMHYLVLEKGADRKVLIPCANYLQFESGQSSLHPLAKLDNKQGSYYRYFLYTVQPSSPTAAKRARQTQLLPQDREGRLFLSMIMLWHHNYEEALQLLVGHGGQQGRYSVDEREILKSIAKLGSENQDHTPVADVVRLQARIHLMRNERNFGFDQRTEDSLANDLAFIPISSLISYEKYLSQPSSWGQFQLQQDDEHFFLRELLATYPKETFIPLLARSHTKTAAESLYDFLQQRLKENQADEASTLTFNRLVYTIPPSAEQSDSVTVARSIAWANQGILGDILTADFSREQIASYYQAVRTHDPDLMRAMIQQITGSDFFHSLDTDALTSALDQVLDFIASDSTQTRLLRNVLRHYTAADLPEQLTVDDLDVLKIEIEQIFLSVQDADSTYFKDFDPSKLWKRFLPTPSSRPRAIVADQSAAAPAPGRETTMSSSPLTIPHLPDLVEFHVKPAMARHFMVITPSPSLNATREELANDLDITTNQTVANRVISQLRDDIMSYGGPANAQSYALNNWPALENFGRVLAQEQAATNLVLDTLKRQIETLIRKEPSGKRERAARRLEIASKRQLPLAIEDAIHLYLRHSPDTFQALNPALNHEDQQAFLALMHRYLVESTNQQHRTRIQQGISDIADYQKAKGLETVPQKLADNLGRALYSRRAYDPVKHPEYLVLEHFMGILLWDKQVEALDTLLIKEGVITARENLGAAIELIMGSGKTDVLLPLICLLNADGKNLAIGIVPRVLLAENAAELSARVGPAFRQVLDVVSIGQGVPLDLAGLINLYENLQYAIKNRRVVMMADSDVQGLFLKFADATIDAKDLQGYELHVKLQEISEFRKIFRLLHNSGVPAIDEPDTIFNAKLSQHQTKGAPVPLPDTFTQGTKAFMLALGRQASSGSPFQETSEIADHIAGVAVQPHRGMPFEGNPLMRKFVSQLLPLDKTLVAAFLKGSNDPAVIKFMDQIPAKVGAANGEIIQDVLSILREQISTLAPLIFSKKYRFDFGPPVSEEEIDQVDKVEDLLAIPHKKGNPSIGSKPGTELEEVLYTYRQFLLRPRLPKTFFKNIAEQLRKKAISEAATMHKRPEELPAYQELLLIFGDQLQAESLTQPFDDGLIESALDAYASEPARLVNFIHQYIIKEIQFYPNQLNSNAQFYRFLDQRLLLAGRFGMASPGPGSLATTCTCPTPLRKPSPYCIKGPIKPSIAWLLPTQPMPQRLSTRSIATCRIALH